MASSTTRLTRHLILRTRHSPSPQLRFLSTSSSSSRHNDDPNEYSKPSGFLGSWSKTPHLSCDPKEAQLRLAILRRDYGKQVKALRMEFIKEMKVQRKEHERQDEKKREELRKAKEERKAKKAELAKVKAEERKVVDEEFRQMLLKERAEKLEYWRMREQKVEGKKNEKKELLRRQSSMWIGENELEKKILEAIVDSSPLLG